MGYEWWPKSINSIGSTNLIIIIIIIYEIERIKNESKRIILGFVGIKKSNEKKKRMWQLTNFNETIRLEIWNQFKLQFFI